MSYTWCHCSSCDANSPLSRSGVPTGVRFTKHAYKAHQLRVNREATDSLSEATDVTGDTTENLDEGAMQVFTTTILDEGPDLGQLPSKLWTTHCVQQMIWAIKAYINRDPLFHIKSQTRKTVINSLKARYALSTPLKII